MKRGASVIALCSALFAAGAAHGAEVKTTCTRGADARTIEVVAPGEVGQSCDVRYIRSGGANVSVPYHADNSDTFCNEKAREMVANLASSGFSCAAAPPALRAETAAATDYVVEARRQASVEPAPAATPVTPAPTLAEAAPVINEPAAVATEVAAAAAPSPAQIATAPAKAVEPMLTAVAEAPADEAAALEEQMNDILAQPAVESASGAPAQLVGQRAETPAARPQPEAVGRLVGAAPEAVQQATPVTQAAMPAPEPEPEPEPAAEETAAPEPAPVAAPVAAPAATAQPEKAPPQKAANGKTDLRAPRDVIRATLMAQAAAWNEGDLDGFMNTYWKSDDLKFVSGVNMTKGWTATQKRYRDRYASGEGLGQLALDNLDIKLVTDDVAVATGKFNLVRAGQTSTGLFTLVFRRDGGAWRIVHDHTNPDPASQ